MNPIEIAFRSGFNKEAKADMPAYGRSLIGDASTSPAEQSVARNDQFDSVDDMGSWSSDFSNSLVDEFSNPAEVGMDAGQQLADWGSSLSGEAEEGMNFLAGEESGGMSLGDAEPGTFGDVGQEMADFGGDMMGGISDTLNSFTGE